MELPFTEPTGVNILHVDDDPGLVDLASECLPREDESFTVKTETDPTAVPGRLEDERVDCIVSDYEMPEIDGLELVERVQSVDASIPFILFTGRGSEAVAAEALDSSVDAYIQKESSLSIYAVLANRIRSLVDKARATRQAEKISETYELVARTATDAFWLRDMTTGATLYSDGISQFGYEPGVREDGFEWWVERVHPDDRDLARELNERQEAGESTAFDDVDAEHGRFTHEYRWQTADGEYVPLRSRGIVRFADDTPVEMVGAMVDVRTSGAENYTEEAGEQ
ncbi:MAG: response regulator containing CheY-like receiver, AAA-type ATPase, and DNA-binding domain protein [uncultured archaeon A07HN63]|nr:MAG: response regulator containing CheY-like receiver, AAA-type ATPase, and DNA-binding domain protein [uncultured archaeon A07HN63]